jgi:hypothetical protein
MPQTAMDKTYHPARTGEAGTGVFSRLAQRSRTVSICAMNHLRELRANMIRLGENSSLLLTPFERNIQLWRQLWRVLERSHLVVQIVDARNPLGFRCVDLESYVGEIGDDSPDAAVPGKGKRRSLLLINKADLLTVEQRSV